MIIWLASYPKSGNTWLRMFLKSYFLKPNEKFSLQSSILDSFKAQGFPDQDILDHLKDKKLIEGRKIYRISFNEITSSAIRQAVENPRDIDQFLVEAYLARRVLDHLIGFKVSPLLWRHVPRAKSAGRVQSPALRMICTREDEIDAFCPEEFWPLKVDFKAKDCTFSSDLIRHDGEDLKKVPINTEGEAVNL